MERPPEHETPPPSPQPPANGSTPAAPSPSPDAEALRGTRFEFGGRRPYSFAPARVAVPTSTRPLPGIGTVALGKIARIVPYGAFVDFLGFRGMIHVSQLQPGQRVERVEDVVQLNDEVQIRVIGVDPERRHINLTLVTKLAPGQTPPTAEPSAKPAAHATPPAAPAVEAKADPDSEVAAPPVDAPPPASPAPRPQPRTIARSSQRLSPRPPAPKPAPKAPPPAVAQHGARAIRRELVDPRHPMARLLASAPESVVRPSVNKERPQTQDATATPAPPPLTAPQPPPLHVFGPDPEPEQDQPATLEALAARFAQRRDAAKPTSKSERSRAEREKQAQILAKLREDAAKFAK